MSLKERLWFRLLSLGLLILLGGLLGNLVILGLLYYQGADISGISGMSDLVDRFDSSTDLKAVIGINHIMMFTFSSLVYLFIFNRSTALRKLRLGGFNFLLFFLFLALLVFSYPLLGLSVYVLEQINLPEWATSMDEDSMNNLYALLAMDNFNDLLLNLLIIAVLPAIGEELLFRGIVQNAFMGRLNNPHVAIFIAAFIFSAFHLEILGFIPKFLIGIILGYSYYVTQSLWVPIILHYMNNGSQVVSLYVMGGDIESLQSEAATTEQFPFIAAIVSIIICYFVVRAIIKNSSEKQLT